jgi:hypothetical protein
VQNSIDQWDPSNEILHKTYFSKALGYDVRPWYFNATKALDPTAQLFLSDYNMVEACDDAVVWPEAAMDFVTFLRQQVSKSASCRLLKESDNTCILLRFLVRSV